MITLVVVLITAIVTLFVNLVKPSASRMVAQLGLVAALGTCFYDHGHSYEDPTKMLYFTQTSTMFSALVIFITLIIIGMSEFGMKYAGKNRGDVYGLMLFSVCGAIILFSFSNLLMLFLGVEILSIPLYVLAGSNKENLASNESALKYYLQGAFATGILLFGMALVYGASGSFAFGNESGTDITAYQIFNGGGLTMFNIGVMMMMFGMGFKIAAAPFHFWSADVYEGAPDLVTAFMATVVKTAGIAAMALFMISIGFFNTTWITSLAVMAALSLVIGNFSALKQMSFKRTMAYSSISHAGYLLIGLTVNDPMIIPPLYFYLIAYTISTIILMIGMNWVAGHRDSHDFNAFHGLAKKHPILAGVMAVAMLSMAGLPPLAGFFGKYFMFEEAIRHAATQKMGGLWWLVVIGAINSVVSIYYYFRVIIAMFFTPELEGNEIPSMPKINSIILVILTIGLILAPFFLSTIFSTLFNK